MSEDTLLSSAPPLYQTATFGQPDVTEFGPYDYTRSGNPTRTLLESQLAEIELEDPTSGECNLTIFYPPLLLLSFICSVVLSVRKLVFNLHK